MFNLIILNILLIILIYNSIIIILPALFMFLITLKLCKNDNQLLKADKRTYKDRNIVIPCPDFLYSTLSINFKRKNIGLLIKAPKSIYSSLGIYDDNARCVNIINHSNKELKTLIIGPQVNRNIEKLYPNMNIYSLPTSTGLLLHRYLMPSNEDYTELREKQLNEITCEIIDIPKEYINSFQSLSLPLKFITSLFTSTVSIILFPLIITLLYLHTLNHPFTSTPSIIFYLSISLLISLIIAIILTLITLKLLKKPSFVISTGIMKLIEIKLWKFNILEAFGDKPLQSSSLSSLLSFNNILDPYRNLVYFLHGALGLTPSEVQYGGTLVTYHSTPNPSFSINSSLSINKSFSLLSSSSFPLVYIHYDQSYCIDIPTLSLKCAWWSITLYGHDLYLLPNEQHIYSINSYQLLSIENNIITSLKSLHPSIPLPTIIYRVYCGETNPNISSISQITQSISNYITSPNYNSHIKIYIPIYWIPMNPPEGYCVPPYTPPIENNEQQKTSKAMNQKYEDISPRFIIRGNYLFHNYYYYYYYSYFSSYFLFDSLCS